MNRPLISSRQQTPLAMPIISEDGYIRLLPSQLKAVRLIHLISGLDEYPAETTSCGAMPTAITGYTEWISHTVPAITIGWDWQMQTPVFFERISEPRSNIMLKAAGSDIGPAKTAAWIEAYIDSLDWEKSVLDCIGLRYSG